MSLRYMKRLILFVVLYFQHQNPQQVQKFRITKTSIRRESGVNILRFIRLQSEKRFDGWDLLKTETVQ